MDTELFKDQYRVATARLRGYDYGQNGAYFVTICTRNRVRYFGEMEVSAQDWTRAYLRPTPLAAIAAAC
ncbi:hypothetical protein H8B15_02015 [Hymenobacter sp. BT507]|uniref:Uncharacterized protein n=1 Tax=Hymenobacter citatus TaxID=2763506 RepID=A0ABR7MF35_9BACT|nr:hypothetical protein [Hymenobacter citatus]MBC6609679.1 hypothetical protein [Hymenobacter citatus]